MAVFKFRVNQYNWFGQKLAASQCFDEVLSLRHYLLARAAHAANDDDETTVALSGHLSYLSAIALLRTSTRLSESIVALQQLNFNKNGQHLLSLCKCLLYLGNHDALINLVKQALNRELPADQLGFNSGIGGDNDDDNSRDKQNVDLNKTIDIISTSRLINDARLWFVFATSLEIERQFKHAELAYRIASKLALGTSSQLRQQSVFNSANEQDSTPPLTCDYDLPHTKLARFCLRHKYDFKGAAETLRSIIACSPPNVRLYPQLALVVCADPQKAQNKLHLSQAIDLIVLLDRQMASVGNPSKTYNEFAFKCKQKIQRLLALCGEQQQVVGTTTTSYEEFEARNLASSEAYALIKSYIFLNSIVQENNSEENTNLFKATNSDSLLNDCCASKSGKAAQFESAAFVKVDQAIQVLRAQTGSGQSVAANWNNLGLCYLIRRRLVASLSCLLKAQSMSPLDWRLNYNLALVYLQIGLLPRALVCLLAALRLRPASSCGGGGGVVSTLLAVCYGQLGACKEARRLFAESTIASTKRGEQVDTFSLVNYLLLLLNEVQKKAAEKVSSDEAEDDLKLIGRLLDLLELSWLQRNQNSEAQFNVKLLEVARTIGDWLAVRQFPDEQERKQIQKTFAWTKQKCQLSQEELVEGR